MNTCNECTVLEEEIGIVDESVGDVYSAQLDTLVTRVELCATYNWLESKLIILVTCVLLQLNITNVINKFRGSVFPHLGLNLELVWLKLS